MPKTEIENDLTSNSSTEQNPKISFQQRKRSIAFSRLKRKILKHVWLVRAGLITVAILAIYLLFIVLGFVFRKTGVDYYFSLASDFVFTPEEKVKIIDNKTNILVLGKGGGGHEAPDLTDTIIFVSVDHADFSISMISLPRDIWIPALRTKLNSTYYWGNQKEGGGGLKLTKSSVEEIVGQPVQYGVVVDFFGFKKLIDVLDGVEVDVETSFVDEKYPIAGREDDECDDDPEYKCRYETIYFEAGRQKMDGEMALKFSRSRNAEGDEGTDFARSKRQQKVIEAIKEKVLSREILLTPKKLLELRDTLLQYSETDIDTSAAAILARRVLQSKDSVNSHVLPEDLLENPPKSYKFDNLYVFIPKAEDWSEVHEWVEGVLENR